MSCPNCRLPRWNGTSPPSFCNEEPYCHCTRIIAKPPPAESPARDWWLRKDGVCDIPAEITGDIHVIEHSSYLNACRERDELKELHRQATRFVVPGEVDTSDAYFRILAEVKKERDELHESLQHGMEENAQWIVELKREILRLKAALERIEEASWKECRLCGNSSEYAYEIAREALDGKG